MYLLQRRVQPGVVDAPRRELRAGFSTLKLSRAVGKEVRRNRFLERQRLG